MKVAKPEDNALRLVVNADDLGMSGPVNDAVFDALWAGWCRSASILANAPATGAALTRAARVRGVSFGVHLNLSEFAPLTRGLDLWLDTSGAMTPRSMGLGRAQAEAVLAEWEAQVARVRAAGIVVSHLDSHQHLHQRPALFPVLCRLAKRVGVRRVRGMGALRLPAPDLRGRLGALGQRVRAARFVARLRAVGLVTTDGFASAQVFLAHAGGPAGWRTAEVMVHPGNTHSPRYAEEVAMLAGGALAGLARSVEIVSWSEL